MLAELGAEEGRHDVAVGIGDDRHHDQAGRDELHVVVAADLAHPPADEAAEDHEVQGRGDRRRHDGLAPDADDAAELPDDDRREADPLGARARFRSCVRLRRRRQRASDVDQADEQLLEAVHLVAHAAHVDSAGGEDGEESFSV